MGEPKTKLRPELRIYCLCGQKMKVSASMYSRPGKCVACRQKIRIPRLDEVPAGVTELYLRDHPELLRKSQPLSSRRAAASDPAAGLTPDPVLDQDLLLGDEEKQERAVPVDPLRQLQVLNSYEHRISERLADLREAVQDTERAREKTALMGYRALVRNARAELDEQLRQRMHELTDQLSETRERIARATLALRVGDLSFAQYLETATPLRLRRDRLEKRRVNLAGWLHTHDPFLAGGYLDLPYEDIPVSSEEVGFAVDEQDGATGLQTRLGALRDALAERDEARKKQEGAHRMLREDGVPPEQTRRLIKDAEARVQRARARVEFERGRAEQFIQDCESDIRAIRAHLEEAQAGVGGGSITAQAYAEIERQMLQAQGDLNESRALARKALRAERPAEVPGPKSTFIRRMKKRDNEPALAENLTAWISAAGLGLTALLPLAAGQVGSNLVNFPAMVAILLAGGVAFAATTMLPNTPFRGVSMLTLWVLVTVLTVLGLRMAQLGLTPVGGLMRTNPQWMFTPGMLLLAASLCGLGLAASVTLAKFERWRSVPILGALFAVACISLIVTDGARLMVGRPDLGDPIVTAAPENPALKQVSIPVSNTGWRPFWIGGSLERVPDPVRFVLEKKVGEQLSWEDYTPRNDAARGAGSLASNWLDQQQTPVTRVLPGETRNMQYTLDPGVYRVSLIAMANGPTLARLKEFIIEPPAAPSETTPAPAVSAEDTPDDDAPAGAPPAEAPAPPARQATVKLQGVLDSQGNDPQFSIVIETADGRIVNERVGLGAPVAGEWFASEYSPATQTLTISNGARLLVLERAVAVPIEYTE